jgi:multidrug resistance protein, MATE family
VQASLTADPPAAVVTPTLAEELSALLRLAVPLALANFGQTLIGAVDTAVVGRLGELELGATGLGNSVFFTAAVLGLGLMLGLDPLVAQALGAGERGRARRALWQGVWLAVAIGVPLTLVTIVAGSMLERFGIGAPSAEQTRLYLAARAPSLIPFLLFVAARSYLQAAGITRPMVVAVVLANLVNLPLSWILVFGSAPLGLPALGVAGAAWASSACTVIQLAVLAAAVRAIPLENAAAERRPDPELLKKSLAVGTPIGLCLLAEFGIFSLVNVLMGSLGTRALAAHQVAITIASATFMVPVGIGAAAAVRVGRAVGKADAAGARLAGFLSIGVGAAFMLLAAAAFLLAPRLLAGVVTTEVAVIEAVVPLLMVAAVFQLSDGVQAVAAGALRGAGDTRFALLATLAGHYLVGLPIGVLLAFWLELGAVGLWWGLVAGLTAVALALGIRFARLSARPIARV